MTGNESQADGNSTEPQEEDRIANLTLIPRNEFNALQLYTDTLVINYLDGTRVEEIVDWEIVDVDGITDEEYEAERVHLEGWVEDQLETFQCSDVTDMWAVSTRTICIEDAEGIVYTVELETQA